MKKIYLLAGALVGSLAVNAQQTLPTHSAHASKSDNFSVARKGNVQAVAKAPGDVAWGSDFEGAEAANWSHVAGATHTFGDWGVVTVMTPSLSAQSTESGGGPYGFPVVMNSPTGDVNGGQYALINSDAEGGGAVQDAYFEYNQDIDLSALGTTSLSLRWHEIYRHFQETNFVEYSNDGGTTWEPAIQVNDVGVNVDSQDPAGGVGTEVDFVILPTPAAGWATNVRVRFHYVGTWDWYWGVDDVEIYETFGNDLELKEFWAYSGNLGVDYTLIPTSQTSFTGFNGWGIIENDGANDQAAASLLVEEATTSYSENGQIINAGGNNLLSATQDTFYIDGAAFDIVTAGAGSYTLDASADLGGAADDNMSNNSASFTAEYGGTEFARDNGTAEGSIGGLGGTLTDAALTIGNVMEMFDDMSITHIKMYIPSFNDNTIYEGLEVFGSVYAYDDGSFVVETERHALTATDFGTWISLPLLDGNQEILTAGTGYIVCVNNDGGTDAARFGTAQAVEEQTVRGIDPTDQSVYSLTDPNAIMVRLVEGFASIDETAAVSNVTIYPNPAVNDVNVQFELANAADASYTVTDLSGKVIFTNNLGNVAAGVHTLNIPTTGMANGVYFYNFTAGETVISEKLVIKK